MIRFQPCSRRGFPRQRVCLATILALIVCLHPFPPASARSSAGPAPEDAHGDTVASQAPETNADALMQDAMVHIIMGLDAYSAGDFPGTVAEFDVATGPLIDAGMARNRNRALRRLDKRLPAGYGEFNLVKVYRHAKKQAKDFPTYVEGSAVDQNEANVGGPQGMGVESEAAEPAVTPEPEERAPESASGMSEEDVTFVRREIEGILEEFGETEYPHSEVFENHVLRFIELYQTDLHGFFSRSMIRSAKYLPMVEAILEEKGVPDVMAYIAFVESGFRPNAVSRAGAVGLWQFMPSTARAYGLKVGRGIDERRDPIKSTVAAREYFLDLVAIFGSRSFLLAIASYNAGEGKVQYCLKQVDDPFTQRTFWDIAPCLRKETREYIPRVIAAAIVARDADRFGFGEAGTYLDRDRYTTLSVPVPVRVDDLARACQLSTDQLRAMNLELADNRTTTPAPYRLLIPADKRRRVERLLARAQKQAEASRVASKPDTGGHKTTRSTTTSNRRGTEHETHGTAGSQPRGRTKYVKYAVQRGNTLSGIAKDFGTTVAKLKSWNPYLGKRGLQAGDTLFIYDLDWSYRKWTHKVVPGDTLGGLALAYGVSIDDIRRWNGIQGDVIRAGQRIVIYTHGKATRIAERHVSGPGDKGRGRRRIAYVVQRGNNLSMIAAMFDVRFRDIMRWNNLRDGVIYPGQTLVIYPGSKFKVVRYRVKRGDTLIGIAGKYHLDPDHLAAINGLKNADHLEVGQELVIYEKQ